MLCPLQNNIKFSCKQVFSFCTTSNILDGYHFWTEDIKKHSRSHMSGSFPPIQFGFPLTSNPLLSSLYWTTFMKLPASVSRKQAESMSVWICSLEHKLEEKKHGNREGYEEIRKTRGKKRNKGGTIVKCQPTACVWVLLSIICSQK